MLYLIPDAGYKLPIPATNWVCSYSNSVYLPSTELTYHTIIPDTNCQVSVTRYTGNKPGIPTRCWTRVSTTGASDQTAHRKGDDDTETSHDLLQVILRKKEEKKRKHGLPSHKNIDLIRLLTNNWFRKKFKIVVRTTIIKTPPPPHTHTHTHTKQQQQQQQTNKPKKQKQKTISLYKQNISCSLFLFLSFSFFYLLSGDWGVGGG